VAELNAKEIYRDWLFVGALLVLLIGSPQTPLGSLWIWAILLPAAASLTLWCAELVGTRASGAESLNRKRRRTLPRRAWLNELGRRRALAPGAAPVRVAANPKIPLAAA